MEVDTVIIRNMVVVMDTALLVGTDILMEALVMEEDTNRMAKDTEVDMEVTETTNSEAMAVTVATNSEDMEATEVVMATLIPIIPQTKMNTSQKLILLELYFNHVFYSVISNIH